MKDVLATVAPRHDVVISPGGLNANAACHAPFSASGSLLSSSCTLTPFPLRDKETGDVKKYGETTRGEDKFGEGEQKRYSKKFLKENNLVYAKEASGTKKDMHQLQHEKIIEHKGQNDGKRPDLNKNDY